MLLLRGSRDILVRENRLNLKLKKQLTLLNKYYIFLLLLKKPDSVHIKVNYTVFSPFTGNVNVSGPTTVISRRSNNNNTSVTLINQNSITNQRMSVFEPYPMRDTIQVKVY